jgi:hypothetical protein
LNPAEQLRRGFETGPSNGSKRGLLGTWNENFGVPIEFPFKLGTFGNFWKPNLFLFQIKWVADWVSNLLPKLAQLESSQSSQWFPLAKVPDDDVKTADDILNSMEVNARLGKLCRGHNGDNAPGVQQLSLQRNVNLDDFSNEGPEDNVATQSVQTSKFKIMFVSLRSICHCSI